ncbi:hypothetical protein [Stenoxybacter acetivorans]|uniref:hypothetical protein n=1 Tax=Stenoxybacter acetivorans TaxID=422441 RepID=UPI00056442D8|nr:hypothetical protein [Stenoxybacter acetivorans]
MSNIILFDREVDDTLVTIKTAGAIINQLVKAIRLYFDNQIPQSAEWYIYRVHRSCLCHALDLSLSGYQSISVIINEAGEFFEPMNISEDFAQQATTVYDMKDSADAMYFILALTKQLDLKLCAYHHDRIEFAQS